MLPSRVKSLYKNSLSCASLSLAHSFTLSCSIFSLSPPSLSYHLSCNGNDFHCPRILNSCSLLRVCISTQGGAAVNSSPLTSLYSYFISLLCLPPPLASLPCFLALPIHRNCFSLFSSPSLILCMRWREALSLRCLSLPHL